MGGARAGRGWVYVLGAYAGVDVEWRTGWVYDGEGEDGKGVLGR